MFLKHSGDALAFCGIS